MAILRCLQRIIKNSNSNSNPLQRLYLTSLSLTKPPPPPTTTTSPISLLCRHHPLSADVTFPFNGPLFLSSPPWKLSQSATPLLLQSDVVFPKLKLGFPLKLGFRETVDRSKENESEVVGARIGDGGFVDSFVTLPNFKLGLPLKLGFHEKVDPSKENELEIVGSRISDSGFFDSFVNLPNFVSFSRMVSGPVLGWMIINEWYLPAFVGLAVSGATDWLDGYLARRMGINSVVGSYLDPLADKVLVGCVAVAMVENNLLHPGIVGLVVLRDVMLVGGAVYKRASSLGWQWKSWYDFFNLDGTRPEKVEPLFISKVNTVFQLLLVAGALLQPELGTPETQPYITYLSWLVASTTVASTAAYGVKHMRNRSISVAGGH